VAIQLDTVVARNEALLSADVGAEVVMLHVEKNAYYDTDAIGSDIWRRIETPISVNDLCVGLTGAYDVDVETCRRDVFEFLNEAFRERVVRIVS
jgi:hypothetical protein